MLAHEISSGLENGASFEKRFDPVPAVFAADTGVLESTPGRLGIVDHAIDYHATGSKLRGYSARARDVRPDDRGVQSISGVVGDADRIALRLVGNDAEYRAEYLFPCDRHVVLHVHEYRRLDVV